jgi:hypothetical protein
MDMAGPSETGIRPARMLVGTILAGSAPAVVQIIPPCDTASEKADRPNDSALARLQSRTGTDRGTGRFYSHIGY